MANPYFCTDCDFKLKYEYYNVNGKSMKRGYCPECGRRYDCVESV